MNKQKQAVLTLGYEFMFAEYTKEKRRTKHQDPVRLLWFEAHLRRYQEILQELFPAEPFDFTEL